ncbi:hypothetical protein LEMLEM_LOCUS20045 [Lemmus lemmus]
MDRPLPRSRLTSLTRSRPSARTCDTAPTRTQRRRGGEANAGRAPPAAPPLKRVYEGRPSEKAYYCQGFRDYV